MDPIDVATSLVGLLGSAGKVMALLMTVKKSITEAPQLMDQMIAQIKELEISLSAVQSFICGISSAPRRRISMIRVEQLVAILTEAVLTFSELEALVTSIAKDKGRLPIMSRLMTLWKEDVVTSIMLRLERHKSSLSLMLNIAQCESDLEAEQSRETLQGVIAQLLRSNNEISLRLQTIEENLETGSVLTYCFRNGHRPDVPEEEPPKETASSRATSEETSSHELDASTQDTIVPQSGGELSGFHVDLGMSRVYMRTEQYNSDVSFTSSAVRSHAWSVFTGMSLSEVSVISAIALPLYLDEIHNNAWYTRTVSHSSYDKTMPPMPLTNSGKFFPEGFSNVEDELRTSPTHSGSSSKNGNATQESVTTLASPSEWTPLSRHLTSYGARSLRNVALYKLVILGDEGVGQTDLVNQHYLGHEEQGIYSESFRMQVAIDGQTCLLELLDPTQEVEYTALRDMWIRDGDGFVLVYSITSRSSFTRIQRWHNKVSRIRDSATWLPLIPTMLVGNKSHLATEREVSTQEGHALAKEFGCEFLETSVKYDINVENAFYDVVRIIRRQRIQEAMQLQPQNKPLRKNDDYSTTFRSIIRKRDQPLRRLQSFRDRD